MINSSADVPSSTKKNESFADSSRIAGGKETLAIKLEKTRPMMLRIANYQLRNQATAEDVVQQTCMAILKGYDNFNNLSSFSTWAISILRRKIIDEIRRLKRERVISESSLQEIDEFEGMFKADGHWHHEMTDWSSPETLIENLDFRRVLDICIERLPEKMGRAFVMRDVMGFDTDEICEALSISPSNCWVLLYRARMRLRDCLDLNWFQTS